ncbi:unnamed protein product, partial [Mesorhabditis belari]|uniref:TGF-beta family profile domain-containing protein n=1 Tax=Mesorhabditis belari TaxID=2138241 RepID=A0AAF3EH35_9BILA
MQRVAPLLLSFALFTSWLPGLHLCSASTVLPDKETMLQELERATAHCAEITDENLLFHCVTRAKKRLEIKNELEKTLKVPANGRIPMQMSEESLKKILVREGYNEDGTLKSEEGELIPSAFIVPVMQNPSFLPENRHRSYFDFKDYDTKHVKEAILNIFIKGIYNPNGLSHYDVHVYKFISDEEVDLSPIWSYRRSREMSMNGNWDTVDITDLVKEWGANPESNFGMMIRVEPEDKNYPDDFDPVERNSDKSAMFLEVKKSPPSRARRSLAIGKNNTCKIEANHPDASCCRYSLLINFKEFGWDWVVAPAVYNAYYCAGRCKKGHSRSSSHHAMLLEFTNAENMCCSPERLTDLQIIYTNNQTGAPEKTVIKNSIVQSCGCK